MTENKIELPQTALFPASPPDYIFKNRKNREVPGIEVAQKYVTYLYDRVDYIEGEGIFSYYQGITLPRKGLAVAQAVNSVNSTKRFIINLIKLLQTKELLFPMVGFGLMTKKSRGRLIEKFLVSFNEIAYQTMGPFYLKDGYYCKTAKEVRKFVKAFFVSLGVGELVADLTGEIMAMIFEFDDAYRYRFQDLMTETSLERILSNFPKEMERLLALEIEREFYKEFNLVIPKIQSFHKVIGFLWKIPSLKRALKAGFQAIEFKNWQLDEGDIYFNYLYQDYNIGGKSMEERVKTYLALYDNDMEKCPKRVQIEMTQNEQAKA